MNVVTCGANSLVWKARVTKDSIGLATTASLTVWRLWAAAYGALFSARNQKPPRERQCNTLSMQVYLTGCELFYTTVTWASLSFQPTRCLWIHFSRWLIAFCFADFAVCADLIWDRLELSSFRTWPPVFIILVSLACSWQPQTPYSDLRWPERSWIPWA
jgi:hypothetical protein